MPDMTPSIFEHVTAKGDHVISFDEIVYLFFSYFHVVTIPHNRTKVKLFLPFLFFFIVIFFHFLLDKVFSKNCCKSLVINELRMLGGASRVTPSGSTSYEAFHLKGCQVFFYFFLPLKTIILVGSIASRRESIGIGFAVSHEVIGLHATLLCV